ncbi:hypothetical protein GPECTOR_11g273 [Gonium pectorale]|uniref:Cytochrome b561 domain-containing protein n=1 Tax=Gonium pectorale TaxID=33097 RepID=A0A150GPV7_GONPE|nr:hypothetical protein GPECTOR_11g273 [Gonium pectorale]|eukprot:KXZ51834.1 hypothetical protein GPECTOR_11g273 [Gonium pectorale]
MGTCLAFLSAISFTFSDAASTAGGDISLCPGASHSVRVSFGSSRRLALVTASPAVTFTSPSPTSGCPNRLDLGGDSNAGAATSFSATFTVPCSAAGGSILFMVTSAGQTSKRFAQSSKTVSVAGSGSALIAAGGACASAAAACSESEEDEDEDATPPGGTGSSTSNTTSGSGCTGSSLGYQCTAQAGKVTLHWSLNTASAPSNPCTPASRTQLQAADLAANGVLHMAVQTAEMGYVSVGFGPNPGVMYPNDMVLGWIDDSGGAYLNTFYITDQTMDESDIYPPVGSPSWAYDSGVVRDSAGVTTICFSRRLRDARAMASPDLTSVVASAAASGRRRRLAQTNGGTSLGLNWAVSPYDALIQHRSDGVGGLWLDVTSGAASSVGGNKEAWINAHGALMAVSWGLLLPLGALLPAHRWALGDSKLGGKATWFVLHVFFQWTGIATFVAGFVIAYTRLGGEGDTPGGAVGEAHGPIGIAIMAAAGAQVVLAHGARPDPSSPKRRVWNLLHHWLGRSVILLAWANVYIGIYAYHSSQWQASYREWVTPIAVVMGVLVLLDVALRVVAVYRDPAASARKDPYAGGASGVVSPSPPPTKAGGASPGSRPSSANSSAVAAVDTYPYDGNQLTRSAV